MEEEEEEQKEEDTGEDQDSFDAKAKAAAYKKFWNKLPFAPKAVQDKVKDTTGLQGREKGTTPRVGTGLRQGGLAGQALQVH